MHMINILIICINTNFYNRETKYIYNDTDDNDAGLKLTDINIIINESNPQWIRGFVFVYLLRLWIGQKSQKKNKAGKKDTLNEVPKPGVALILFTGEKMSK